MSRKDTSCNNACIGSFFAALRSESFCQRGQSGTDAGGFVAEISRRMH